MPHTHLGGQGRVTHAGRRHAHSMTDDHDAPRSRACRCGAGEEGGWRLDWALIRARG
jgi:hypothetical protein